MNGLSPSGFKNIPDSIPSRTGDVHSYQLLPLNGLAQEEKLPSRTTIQCESLALFDNNQFITNCL